MENKRYILSSLIILLTGLLSFPVEAQQKKATYRADFSAEERSWETVFDKIN